MLSKFRNINWTYFVKGGLWLSLADIVAKGSAILLSVAFARLVSKEFYGQYKFIFSILGMLAVFSLPGLNTAITQSVARGYNSSFFRGVKTRLKWSLLGSIILIGVSLYFKYLKHSNLWLCFLLAAVFFPLLRSLNAINSFFIAEERFDKSSVYSSTVQLVPTVAVLASLYFFKNLFLVILTSFFTVTIVNLYFYYRIPRNNLNKEKADKELLNYGRHLSLMGGITSVAFYLDKLLIAKFLGFEQVAIYSIASVIPESSKSLMKMIIPLTLPKLSNIQTEQVYGKIRSKLPSLFILGFLVVAIGVPILPYLIKFLYTGKYNSSIIYAQILLFSLIFGFPSATFSSVLQSQKSQRELYIFNILYSLLQISFLFVLTPLYGVMGVVLARLIARFGGFIYQWYAVKSLENFDG